MHLSVETEVPQGEVYLQHPPLQATPTISANITVLIDTGFMANFNQDANKMLTFVMVLCCRHYL